MEQDKRITTVKSIMSKKPIAIEAHQTMLDAAQMMSEHSFRHLLVKDAHNKTVGILSDHDVSKAIHAGKTNHDSILYTLSDTKRVSDFMNWPVCVISEDSSIQYAVQEMLLQKISAFIVENENKETTGIVTSEDLLKYLNSILQKDILC
jgi:predicted transcriptional regulator